MLAGRTTEPPRIQWPTVQAAMYGWWYNDLYQHRWWDRIHQYGRWTVMLEKLCHKIPSKMTSLSKRRMWDRVQLWYYLCMNVTMNTSEQLLPSVIIPYGVYDWKTTLKGENFKTIETACIWMLTSQLHSVWWISKYPRKIADTVKQKCAPNLC